MWHTVRGLSVRFSDIRALFSPSRKRKFEDDDPVPSNLSPQLELLQCTRGLTTLRIAVVLWLLWDGSPPTSQAKSAVLRTLVWPRTTGSERLVVPTYLKTIPCCNRHLETLAEAFDSDQASNPYVFPLSYTTRLRLRLPSFYVSRNSALQSSDWFSSYLADQALLTTTQVSMFLRILTLLLQEFSSFSIAGMAALLDASARGSEELSATWVLLQPEAQLDCLRFASKVREIDTLVDQQTFD